MEESLEVESPDLDKITDKGKVNEDRHPDDEILDDMIENGKDEFGPSNADWETKPMTKTSENRGKN